MRRSRGRLGSRRPSMPDIRSRRLDCPGWSCMRRMTARASRRSARLRFVGELVSLGVPPEAFELVEIAALAAEDVHDEVEVIEQDPLRFLDALGQVRPFAESGPQ